MFTIQSERQDDANAIEALHELAFGPGRWARTGFLLREGAKSAPELSFVAHEEGRLIGSIRFAHFTLKGAQKTPMLLLGPLAVIPERQGNGLGLSLIKESLKHAQELDHDLVLLIGRPSYYGKVGFKPVPKGSVSARVPLDQDRLLWFSLSGDTSECPSGLMH